MREEARRADPSDDLKEQALRLVRAEYECIASIASVPLPRINGARRTPTAYQSIEDVIREWADCAGAMSRFAVKLRLITPEQAGDAIREFRVQHPDISLALPTEDSLSDEGRTQDTH